MKSLKTTLVALALAATSSLALAHGGPGWGCPGSGHGHDAAGGCGPGMAGGMCGQGMMDGPGHGMIGMMGMGGYNAINLSDQQRAQINQIHDQLRRRHMELMPRMQEESIRLRDMMASDNPNPAAVGQQQMRVADLHRQMLESAVDARNRMDALLSNEQRAQLRIYRQRWSNPPDMPQPGSR